MQLTTRPANLEDEPFLFQVYAETRKVEVSSWGWSEEQIEVFLRMQYEAQKRSYTSHPVPLIEEIICYNEERVGRFLTRETDNTLAIIDIALLSQFRNRGMGTKLIQRYQEYAKEKMLPIELHVLNNNSVYGLYKRMGFKLMGESPPYLEMKWTPEK